jgi:alpha-tubulin suppressor-like RCC1 family protein
MAVAGSKELYAWGLNSHGQLGLSDTVNRKLPERVVAIPGEGILDIGGGSAHSAALLSNGTVYCWGLGANGRLGLGSENSKLEPTKLPLRGILHLAVGHSHTAAVANTTVYTWGSGSYGRLGHGNQDDQFDPTQIVEFQGKSVRKLVFSVFHSIAIICNGEVWAWGNAKDGRLGVDAGNEENQLVPRRVGVGSNMQQHDIIDVALGLKHGVALASNGTLFSWGDA